MCPHAPSLSTEDTARERAQQTRWRQHPGPGPPASRAAGRRCLLWELMPPQPHTGTQATSRVLTGSEHLLDCHKVPHTTVHSRRSGGPTLKSRCPRGWFLQKVLGEDHSAPASGAPGFLGYGPITPVPASVSTWPSVCHLLGLRTPITGLRAQPENLRSLHLTASENPFLQTGSHSQISGVRTQTFAFWVAIGPRTHGISSNVLSRHLQVQGAWKVL